MTKPIDFGGRLVGPGHPTYLIAEIGINHNGDLDLALRMIDAAVEAGCDAVKFQKRTPEICVPSEQRECIRETPWGAMTYLEYRRRVEFDREQYAKIQRHCRDRGVHWFASCWDTKAIDFMEAFQPVGHKIASATLTDADLLRRFVATGRPLIMSTGMSTWEEICVAMTLLPHDRVLLAHCTSAYPCDPSELNLRMVSTLSNAFDIPIGYSGHEVGLQATLAAVALGACFVERHFTLDRSMWGTDQAASLEPDAFRRLAQDIRVVEQALGDGQKRVYESELKERQKLRRV